MTLFVGTGLARRALEPALPDWLDVRWAESDEDLYSLAPQAEIGWFDTYSKPVMAEACRRAGKLRWLSTIYSGIDGLPLDLLAARGIVLTNGSGLTANAIAEYVLMGMLTMAKGYRDVVRAQERREWLTDAPGTDAIAGSRVLILGYGPIGQLVQRQLQGFGAETVIVRSKAGDGALGPDDWRERLGEFDWIVLAVPDTPETAGMIGRTELAAMRRRARIVNVARGAVIDQDALIEALRERRVAGAFLDVTTPEPLPADHPLWTVDNAHVTMHLSGRSQATAVRDAVTRFVANLERYRLGQPLTHIVDLSRGY